MTAATVPRGCQPGIRFEHEAVMRPADQFKGSSKLIPCALNIAMNASQADFFTSDLVHFQFKWTTCFEARF